jgi:hypothetical protein
MSWRTMASAALRAAVTFSQPAAAQSPTLRGPWFGAGIGTASAQVNETLGASAAALQLGSGYDFRAGNRLWVTPYANLIVRRAGIRL